MIVLDSSAVVEYLALRAHGSWVEEVIDADPDAHSPHLLDVEVASAFRSLVSRGELAQADAESALAELVDLDVARYPHIELIDRIWALHRHVSAYDAAYVALAEVLDATLVTTDVRLARAHGHRARVVSP